MDWGYIVAPDVTGKHVDIYIATIAEEDEDGRVAPEHERDANARLMAAAPDLLDALRRVMRHIPADAGGASLGDDMYRARAAIARATRGDA